MEKDRRKNSNVRLSEHGLAMVDALAAVQSTTRSEIMREALRVWIDAQPAHDRAAAAALLAARDGHRAHAARAQDAAQAVADEVADEVAEAAWDAWPPTEEA